MNLDTFHAVLREVSTAPVRSNGVIDARGRNTRPLSYADIEKALHDEHGYYGGGMPFTELLAEFLFRRREIREVVLDTRTFFQFANELGHYRGTLFPFVDGGIKWAAPHAWVLILPGPVES